MGAYIARRLLLMIPTVFGIMALSFLIVQFAPGGPVDQFLDKLSGNRLSVNSSVTTIGSDVAAQPGAGTGAQANSTYRGGRGLPPQFIAQIEKQFGFDKPPLERFFSMLWNYLRFDFGRSYFKDTTVVDLVIQALPVSISLGAWLTLISYGISIPLGIAKAVRDGSRFDVWTSGVVILGYALPGFLIAIVLIVFFAGGSFWSIFPLKGLWSDNIASLPWPQKILDYIWHMVLPITAMALGGFATTTLLTKNSFLDEIRKQYVVTARAKGLAERQVLYGHVFRNAMLIVIAGFPGAFVGAFFGGSLLIETIFSLEGLGRLGYTSVVQRDYPVVFATLYVFSLIGLVVNLISDLTYMWIDPRIDFESRSE